MLAKQLQGAAKGVAVDSDFENVTLLLHGNGTNGAQNNTFTDGSSNAFSITRNGNTTQGTFSPYGSNWSNYFDGTGDYLTAPSNTAFALGTGDFTVECWFYLNVMQDSAFWGIGTSTNSGGVMFRLENPGTSFNFYNNGDNLFTGSGISANTWYHLAVVRSSGTLKVYVNGTQYGSSLSNSTNIAQDIFYIGCAKVGSTVPYNPINGYISNIRVLKGTAQYTANFTPPTAPLTAVTNTQLLTCQSNRFIDNSTNAFTITRNGDVSVQRFSPFSPTAAYASGTIGGSGYFDGTGDYLTVANNAAFQLGTGDFTLECWYYPEDISLVALFGLWGPTSSNASYLMYLDTSGNPVWYTSTNGSTQTASLTSTVAVTLRAWNHIVITRLSGTTRIFVNGTSGGSTSTSVNLYAATSQFTIGYNPIGGTPDNVQGYLSDVRILKGTGYSSITVPTAPLTNITNTSLLCNFTNAGIIDNAMMNDLETVGNAQISTTQSKFGGGSMYFDGTGDYLRIQPSDLLATWFNSDYTIEYWVYPNAFASSANGGSNVYSQSDPASTSEYFSFGPRASGVVVWYYYNGAVQVVTSGTISTGVWTHLAWTYQKSSNTMRIFINGVLNTTTTIAGTPSISTTANPILVGASTTVGFNGYIDDLRVTKGVARYTANFTAPTAPFADQ